MAYCRDYRVQTDLGKYLKKLRKDRDNISVNKVAKAIGVSQPYLYQIEAGKVALVDPDIFNRLADFFEVPITRLLKKAGYIREESIRKQAIHAAYKYIVSLYADKINVSKVTTINLDTKIFIIRMYEEMSGETVLSSIRDNRSDTT